MIERKAAVAAVAFQSAFRKRGQVFNSRDLDGSMLRYLSYLYGTELQANQQSRWRLHTLHTAAVQ